MGKVSLDNTWGISQSISAVFLTCAFYAYSRFYNRWSSLPRFQPFSSLSFLRIIRNFNSVHVIPPLCYLYQMLTGISQVVREGICVYWVFFTPYVMVHEPRLIKELICHPDAQEKSDVYKVISSIAGQGLVSGNGEHWQNHRKLINPAFNIDLLKEYLSIFNEQAEKLISKLNDSLQEPWINISHFVESCSFDIIYESTLGIKMGCQDGNEEASKIVRMADGAGNIIIHRIFRPWTRNEFLFSFSSLGRKLTEIKNSSIEINNKTLNEKKQSMLSEKEDEAVKKAVDRKTGKKKESFLKRLLNCHFENPGFTVKDIYDEINTMITAGHDTIAITLAYVLFLVGLNPGVQENIIQELDSVFQNDPTRIITYETLREMVYISSVIKETLRIYPTVPCFGRKSRRDIQVENYTIPKGSQILFNLYGVYRNPENFPDPEKFRPERFLPQNARSIPHFAFIPFSAGSRNCIGQKFAMMEMKVILAYIFRNFKVESLDERDKINLAWGITTKNLQPIRIRMTTR